MRLICVEKGRPRRIANGIYQEIIPRELTWSTQTGLIQEPQWYKRPDGTIDMQKDAIRHRSPSGVSRIMYSDD